MIVVFTDFGASGPYLGQARTVFQALSPGIPVVDLCADAPAFQPMLSAYLLAAYAPSFPRGSVFLCVVDPGVGSQRAGGALLADGRWYVGPDNGLFEVVARRARRARWFEITWRPERLTATFHGRDLFAPVAARLARGEPVPGVERPLATMRRDDWPDDLARVVFVDSYGNMMTGIRAEMVADSAVVRVGNVAATRARTFSDVPHGATFWYENANGLLEVAANQGRASELAGVAPGADVVLERP
jgi:S-adenosylmethionine hydrolase